MDDSSHFQNKFQKYNSRNSRIIKLNDIGTSLVVQNKAKPVQKSSERQLKDQASVRTLYKRQNEKDKVANYKCF